MGCVRGRIQVTMLFLGCLLLVGSSQAQTGYGRAPVYRPTPYGSSWTGYPPANYYNRPQRYPGRAAGAQTVTDFRPLIRAITSLPGWNGPPAAAHHPARPVRSVAQSELINSDGKVLWPHSAANNPRLTVARQQVDQAVSLVLREHATYGQATIRHVADARNKLTEFARQSVPSLKARDRDAATELERFIVELQKTLATLTAHY
jgi:hypothetical protein